MKDWFQHTRNKVIVLGAVLVVIFLWGAKIVVFDPMGKHLRIFQKDLVTANQRKELLETIAAYRDGIEKHHVVLAQGTDTSWLIDTINQIAQESGLLLESVRPLAVQRESYYLKLPVLVESQCNWQQLGDFTSRVENSSRFIKFDKVEARGLETPRGDMETMRISLTVSAFSPIKE